MTSATAMPDFTVSANRLAHMREHLRPYWAPIESGGVFLMAGVDEEAYWRFLADFNDLPEVSDMSPDEDRAPVIAELLANDVLHFFDKAELAPGPYELDNYHLEYAPDGKLMFESEDEESEDIFALPIEPVFSFELTAEHLKLLRHMNTRDWRGYIEAMDPKRPYGDMTYFYIDMAETLGEGPLPADEDGYSRATKEQIRRYEKLHLEMLLAIQAFWRYAEMIQR